VGQRLEHTIAPNILDRAFVASSANHEWVADFTYIWTGEGWLYVAVVIDLYSRRAVGWSMSSQMTAQLVTDALLMAIWRRGSPRALLHHSDQGSQYTSERFQRLLTDHGVMCSMSKRGDCWNNAVMESFFSRLRPNVLHERSTEPAMMPRPMCSTGSSDSTIRSADTQRSAISVQCNSNSELS